MKRWTLGRTLKRLGIFLLVFLGTFKCAEWLSDVWWNTALGQESTYLTILQYRFLAFVCGAGVWAAIWSRNLQLAWFYIDGRAQVLELLGPQRHSDSPIPLSYRERGLPRARRLSCRLVFWGSLWLAGLAAANRFDLWLPLRSLSATGQIEPISGRDLAFFFWQLPAIEWGWNFFGVAVLSVLLACITLYSSADLIETGPQLFRVAPRAARHLLTLGATLVLWQGVQQGIAILGAPIAPGWNINTIYGAPEAHFTVPTRLFLVASSVPVAGFILWLSWRGRTNSASGLLCGWIVVALLFPSLAAPFGRSLRLNQDAEEQLAISRHLDATRKAWGLESVTRRTLDVPTGVIEVTDMSAPPTNRVLPTVGVEPEFGQFAVWPSEVVKGLLTLQDTHSERRLGKLHLEIVNGRLMYRALSSRSDATNDFPAVLYEADPTQIKTPFARRIPINSLLISEFIREDRPRTRFEQPSEPYGGSTDTAVVPLPRWRATEQMDFAVRSESILQRLALSLRFFDTSLLPSNRTLTWRLDPVSRAKALLPVADWSHSDPRPVVVGSGINQRLYWLLNGCFTSRFYPNSAMLTDGEEWRGVNYLRENVVCVIDAKTGQTSFYLLAPNEPLASVWRQTLPKAFSDLDSLPTALKSQIRPSPSALGAVSAIWSRYHPATTSTPTVSWNKGSDNWRPLLAGESDSPWNLVISAGDKSPWLSCTFAPSKGVAQSQGTPVVSILALPLANLTSEATNASPSSSTARAPWVEWRMQEPLDFPEFAVQPQPQVIAGQLVPPPPSITTIFPRLSASGDAMDTLFLTHSSLVTPRNRPVEASNTLPPSPVSGPPGMDNTSPGLTPFPTPDIAVSRNESAKEPVEIPKVEVSYGLWGTSKPLQAPRETESLNQARYWWRRLLQARRARLWSDVAQIEQELSRTLGVPYGSTVAP